MEAGADEIAVTPEMIEAGAEELDLFVAHDLVDGWVNRWEVVEAIYRAMRRADRVTQKMIDVAAEVLLMDSFLDISEPTAERLATEMLRRAFDLAHGGAMRSS